MKKPARKQLWKVVKRLILEHPDEVPEVKEIRTKELEDLLNSLASQLVAKAKWASEADYERAALQLTSPQLIKIIRGRKR